MKARVFICSPYRGDVVKNTAYLAAAMRDSLARREAPFAPHALYPAFLDDAKPDDRALGIECGKAWLSLCDYMAVYADLGPPSEGMQDEIRFARNRGIPVVPFRYLGVQWWSYHD